MTSLVTPYPGLVFEVGSNTDGLDIGIAYAESITVCGPLMILHRPFTEEPHFAPLGTIRVGEPWSQPVVLLATHCRIRTVPRQSWMSLTRHDLLAVGQLWDELQADLPWDE